MSSETTPEAGTHSDEPELAPVVPFHIHLVSDSTGETLNSIAKAACAQFVGISAVEHIHALVRSRRQLARTMKAIEASPGVVLYTMMNLDLRRDLEDACRKLQTPCIPVLDPVLNALRIYLGTDLTLKPGGQHEMDAAYFRRIDAMNYSMAHDDGQNTHELNEADIVLVGVSRTSKTPTCIYLANRGVRAANIPIVPERPLPSELSELTRPLVVGLTASPERLMQIRRNRLLSLNQNEETDYIDLDRIRQEVIHARRLFTHHGWTIIDVSRRSIEETAAAIFNLYQERQGGKGIEL